jgi:hypothetical protein
MKTLILLLFPFVSMCQTNLTWANFKAKPNPHHTAMSALSIGWYQSTWEDGVHIRFDSATVEFNEYGSYTNTDDPYILNHEQQHLNILFLQVRAINKWIHIHHIKYTQEQFDAMQLELTRRWVKQDNLYDDQTRNSEDKEMQRKWDLWIAKQLILNK